MNHCGNTLPKKNHEIKLWDADHHTTAVSKERRFVNGRSSPPTYQNRPRVVVWFSRRVWHKTVQCVFVTANDLVGWEERIRSKRLIWKTGRKWDQLAALTAHLQSNFSVGHYYFSEISSDVTIARLEVRPREMQQAPHGWLRLELHPFCCTGLSVAVVAYRLHQISNKITELGWNSKSSNKERGIVFISERHRSFLVSSPVHNATCLRQQIVRMKNASGATNSLFLLCLSTFYVGLSVSRVCFLVKPTNCRYLRFSKPNSASQSYVQSGGEWLVQLPGRFIDEFWLWWIK